MFIAQGVDKARHGSKMQIEIINNCWFVLCCLCKANMLSSNLQKQPKANYFAIASSNLFVAKQK